MNDKKLTDNFSLYDLTKTDHPEFQDMNRDLSIDQIGKLTLVARLLEHVVYVIGPITISSGYRCPELNETVGSTPRSQHLLCEAADFIPSENLVDSFKKLWDDVKNNGTNVGQLIHEMAGDKEWIHISLGTPYRPASKCKQILEMQDGKYTLLA